MISQITIRLGGIYGFSTSKVFEDESCYISMGGSQTAYGSGVTVVVASFKTIPIYLVAGEALQGLLMADGVEKAQWPRIAFEYFLKYCDNPFAILTDACKRTYDEGVQVGRRQKVDEIRDVLHAD